VVNPTDDLPYTPLECEAVASLFDPTERLALVGSEATREAVVAEARGTRYLHFSCPGFYNWRDVMHSGLALGDNLPWTLTEILSPQFDLSAARLVTLSACETGITEFRRTPMNILVYQQPFCRLVYRLS
jgi:CHAT domain-containing protein